MVIFRPSSGYLPSPHDRVSRSSQTPHRTGPAPASPGIQFSALIAKNYIINCRSFYFDTIIAQALAYLNQVSFFVERRDTSLAYPGDFSVSLNEVEVFLDFLLLLFIIIAQA